MLVTAYNTDYNILGSTNTASTSRMIGKRVGIYEIVEEVGGGGMATVYRAYQPNVDRYVAVKIIHQRIVGDKLGSSPA
jgi:serine/threonine protein kinase